jgi:hypothetical protein
VGTTTNGLPYPESTDPIAEGATAIQALAESLDPNAWTTWTTGVPSGWTVRVMRIGPIVWLYTSLSGTLATGGTTIATGLSPGPGPAPWSGARAGSQAALIAVRSGGDALFYNPTGSTQTNAYALYSYPTGSSAFTEGG